MESHHRTLGPVNFYAAATAATTEEYDEERWVPDGEYDAAIEGLRFTESPSSFIPMMVWTFRIRLGTQSNCVLRKHRPLTGSSLRSVRDELTKCGIPLRRFSELPERALELIGRDVRIVKRTQKGIVALRILWSTRPPSPRTDHAQS